MRGEVLGLGVLVLIIGIVAYFYPQQVNLFGTVITVGYPYRDLGTVLIAVGFIALIGGAAMKNESEKMDEWRQRGAQRAAIASSSQPRVPEGGFGYCSKCGQSLRPTDAFCPRCGRAVQS